MTQLNPVQTAQAVTLGKLVNVAYAMYEGANGNPLPTPPSPIMTGFEFVAWVQMKDFIISSTDYAFYGFIARDTSKVNGYVLAIRGTQDLEEWWDDLTSMVLVPMTGFGQVGYGFSRIYQTMRVIYPSQPLAPGAMAARAAPVSMESAGTFAAQVSAAVQRHAAAQAAAPAAAAPVPVPLMSITVAGHSLGSALATLYVAENSLIKQAQVPLICTLASPRVGDPTFASTFDGLGIESWRVVNELDLVPNLPFFGFLHVAVEYTYNSGSETVWSLECWHSSDTYLHLLDPTQPLSPSCVWPQPAQAVAAAVASRPAATTPLRASMRLAPAAAAPPAAPPISWPPTDRDIALTAPAGTTINITIKVG
jgi:Lipase (class 3)